MLQHFFALVETPDRQLSFANACSLLNAIPARLRFSKKTILDGGVSQNRQLYHFLRNQYKYRFRLSVDYQILSNSSR